LVKPLIDALFGTERQRSPLWVDDARAKGQQPRKGL